MEVVQRNIMARSLNKRCRGNAKMCSICILPGPHVAVNNTQDRQCTYKCNTEARWKIHCCRRKAIIIAYSECVSVALVIQHEKHMRRIILSYVACLILPYCSTLSHKRQDFQKKLLNVKCMLWFPLKRLFFLKQFSFSEELILVLS